MQGWRKLNNEDKYEKIFRLGDNIIFVLRMYHSWYGWRCDVVHYSMLGIDFTHPTLFHHAIEFDKVENMLKQAEDLAINDFKQLQELSKLALKCFDNPN